MIRRVLLIGALGIVCLLVVASFYVQRQLQRPLEVPSDGYRLMVEQGDSAAAIGRRLQRDGLLKAPRVFSAYARWLGVDARLKAGEFDVRPGATLDALLQQLGEGRVVHYRLTLPEGITLARALDILWQDKRLTRILTGVDDQQLMAMVEPHDSLEGLFFPDSYDFPRGATDLDILQRAFDRMQRVLDREWKGRSAGLPLETPYEALILASIVERETGVPGERGEIAGVFVRRLQKRMRLQTDPTVIYGLGPEFDGNLRRSHLRNEVNLYNTYRHHGLPPTPIALPGLAALGAALHPEPGDALYFVARGDGSHHFSATLEEHNQAVKRYQLQRRSDYRSSPK